MDSNLWFFTLQPPRRLRLEACNTMPSWWLIFRRYWASKVCLLMTSSGWQGGIDLAYPRTHPDWSKKRDTKVEGFFVCLANHYLLTVCKNLFFQSSYIMGVSPTTLKSKISRIKLFDLQIQARAACLSLWCKVCLTRKASDLTPQVMVPSSYNET